MAVRMQKIEPLLARLEQLLADVSAHITSARPALERWRSDAAALRFHLNPPKHGPLLTAVIGGTGTGKSTVVNRLLGVGASATSFRRTFTSGAVAIAGSSDDLPSNWLGVQHVVIPSDGLPARGQTGALVIVSRDLLPNGAPQAQELLSRIVLLDTPDLDGDQPAHHAEADRVFRWAEAIIFLVTPEKYQMTELLPYYRLAARYMIPVLFVMNKAEEQVVIDDYRQQLRGYGFAAVDGSSNGSADSSQSVFIVARDDATYEPPAAEGLSALRSMLSDESLRDLARRDDERRAAGLANRAGDLAIRLEDKVIGPMREDRREADRLVAALRQMETPAPGVDVNPVTSELQRRLQQRSVLYLMGPQRILDRVRQAPGLLVRLPRVAWDYVMRGEVSPAALNPDAPAKPQGGAPDFREMLIDQFAVLQSRLDDVLRASPAAQRWITADSKSYDSARLTPDQAGRIADEELEALKDWLQKRWNATPRDTRAIQALLKYLPGGSKLTKMTESAPYLLLIALVAHHALFGTDLLVLGGYSIATWLSERVSNEVAAHTRSTNARISDRFTRLAHEQIEKLCEWIDRQAPSPKSLEHLDRAALELAQAAGIEEGMGEQ